MAVKASIGQAEALYEVGALHAAGAHAVGVVHKELVGLFAYHALGHGDGHVLNGLGDDGVPEVVLGGLGLALEGLGLQVGLVLVKGVELADVLGELVVKLGQLRLAHGVNLHLEGGVLAGELGGVLLGEGHVDFSVLAGLHADELILEAGDEHAGADLEGVVLGLAAVEGHSVDEALEVDGVPFDGGKAENYTLGKDATFKVKIHTVRQPQLPDEFASLTSTRPT